VTRQRDGDASIRALQEYIFLIDHGDTGANSVPRRARDGRWHCGEIPPFCHLWSVFMGSSAKVKRLTDSVLGCLEE